MIELLHISEYVYLKDVDVYFSNGLNVITGETGTGKSLLLDIVGAFLDYENLRSDTFSADMVLDIPEDFNIAEEFELKAGQHIFTVERRNKRLFYKIDGKLLGRDIVQKVVSNFVAIHKQSSHIKLLDKGFILDVLDKVSGNEALMEGYKSLYQNYQYVQKILNTLSKDAIESSLEDLREKIEEIESARLSAEEEQRLEIAYKEATNTKNSVQNYTSVSQQLEELEYTVRKFYALVDERLHEKVDALVESMIELENSIQKELSRIEEMSIEDIENRLWVYRKLRRKYGPTTEDVLENLSHWKSDYDEKMKQLELLNNADKEKISLETQLEELADMMSQKRKASADKIEEMITQHLRDLNMNARVGFSFAKTSISPTGVDDVELVGSTLSTGPLYPLRKIASGGELSRLMLALELSINTADVLVYDEIDSGVGGTTAVKLAEKLEKLAQEHQIIIVTHLPQIALKADKHFVLTRTGDSGTVSEVSGDARTEEIKRMFGGEEIVEIMKDTKF
ncbi:MAG TPA: chromosome segregation protein SMC [Fervidobacterium sp.]|nr:chromosome segregation protein SMC [Fervidobacterium sp.]HRD19888.1 AAA family ATPase [Fervidobacterium sp.]